MKRIFLSLTMLSAVAFGGDAKTLPGWYDLPSDLENHDVSLVTTDGKQLKGKLLQKGLTDFSIDVSSTPDENRFPRGKRSIPHTEIAELHASIRRAPFRAFAEPAFIAPLNMAVHEYGLCSIFADIGGGGGDDPAICRVIDVLAEPFWLGWAAGGLAITPIVAPIGWLAGSVHYDYRVQ